MTILRLEQKIFNNNDLPSSVKVEVCDQEEDDWEAAFEKLLQDPSPPDPSSSDTPLPTFVGIAPISRTYQGGIHGVEMWIQWIAFATIDRVLVVKAPDTGFVHLGHAEWEALSKFVSGAGTADDAYALVGFEMPSILLSLLREGVKSAKGLDLSELNRSNLPSTIVEEFVGSVRGKDYETIWRRLPEPPQGDDDAEKAYQKTEVECAAWRAWMSVVTARATLAQQAKAIPLDLKPTEALTEEHITALSHLQEQYDLIEAITPNATISEFSAVSKEGTGQIAVQQAAFKNKARKGKAQDIRLLKADKVIAQGRVVETDGKKTLITIEGQDVNLDEEDPVDEIEILGRGDLTRAEVERNRFISFLLQGKRTLESSDFIRKIWFANQEDKDELDEVRAFVKTFVPSEQEVDPLKETDLNESQANAARAMLSEKHSIALVHGPPGTGKTRTISEVVKIWVADDKTSYLIAQTNVGVKNIAEALIKRGISQFRLLVSNDFFQEWHEKEYEKCVDFMIRSTDFKEELPGLKALKVKVILCTLNMLFSSRLDKLFLSIPLDRLIVDEASQIFVGDYLALFAKFSKTLTKVCWFGDPNQLPPHQREQISGLQSVYDIEHVKKASLLLNTQFRMPPEVGRFVSGAMYEGDLHSFSGHVVPGRRCVKFVDVAIGEEKMQKTSWINEREADSIVHLVRNYYANYSFSIITPYDSQRKLIERKLKAEGLRGEGRCYNLDSFQGNEDDYILISCVRTAKTGFLDLHNRINVMLTRCKKGMVIVTQKEFTRTLGRMTLIGRLAEAWSQRPASGHVYGGNYDDASENDPGDLWVYYKDVLNKRVDLPGVDGDPQPIEPQASKRPLAPAVKGFFAIPINTNPATQPTWGSSVKTVPSNTSLVPNRRNPPPLASSGWGQPGPAIRVPSAPPAGAWGAGRPTVSTSRPPTRPATTTPIPASTTFSLGGLPSQTGGGRQQKKGTGKKVNAQKKA